MGLHSLPASCLAWGNSALGSASSMKGLMVTSKRAYSNGDPPNLMLPMPRAPHWAPANPHLYRSPPTLAGSFGSVSCRVTAPFLWVLVCTKFCALQDWSLCFPQSCGSPGTSTNSPGQNTGVGSHFLLQGISPTQGSNPHLPLCRQIL